MLRKTLLSLSVSALLSACGGGGDDYPRLLPTQAILAEPTLPEHAGAAANDAAPIKDAVKAQGNAARASADAIPDPVDPDNLAARAADLRRRAEALRQTDTAAAAPDDCPTETDPDQCPATDTEPPAEE